MPGANFEIQPPQENLEVSPEGSIEGSHMHMTLRDASNGLLRRKQKRHLSPYQKFKNRAMSRIKEKEHWIERITETLAPQVNKEDVNGLNIKEKIAMGKDIVKMMSLEREKLA